MTKKGSFLERCFEVIKTPLILVAVLSSIFHLLDLLVVLILPQNSTTMLYVSLLVMVFRYLSIIAVLFYVGWTYAKNGGKNLLESTLFGAVAGFLAGVLEMLVGTVKSAIVMVLVTSKTSGLNLSNPSQIFFFLIGFFIGILIVGVIISLLGLVAGAVASLLGALAGGVRKVDG
ncbi:MAG: hypothetical protein V1703_00285 [Candidatus Altiarchaeota archaeon]